MRAPWKLALASCLVAQVAAAETLDVLAFNVLFRGADDAASIKTIEAEDADVVCLTELTPTFVKAFEASTLAKTYPYRHFEPKPGTWGVGFASKQPLTRVATLPVPPLKLPAMTATTQLGIAPVELLCVHLNPPAGKHAKADSLATTLEKNDAVRAKQADALVARYATVTTPVVLLGDFNESPGGDALGKLAKAGFRRGCDVKGSSCTATFPGPAEPWPAVFEIDHVFARGLSFSNARTVRSGGSDHFPVRATLTTE